MYIQQLRETVSPPSQNTMTVCNLITLLILYYISFRLVTLRNFNDAPTQFSNIFNLTVSSNIFDLTVSFKFINSSFQIFLLFVPEMSNSFTSYIV